MEEPPDMPTIDDDAYWAEVRLLILKLREWARNGGIGDNGEQSHFDIECDGYRWDITAYSFYDGSGYYRRGSDLLEGLRHVLEEVAREPEKEREREFESAAWGISRWQHCSLDKAKALLREKFAQESSE